MPELILEEEWTLTRLMTPFPPETSQGGDGGVG